MGCEGGALRQDTLMHSHAPSRAAPLPSCLAMPSLHPPHAPRCQCDRCPHVQIVWDGMASPPWQRVTEPELRTFLLERACEGYSFPLNPVWPVRDPGWLEVLRALQQQPEAARNLQSWFPPESGVLDRIVQLHSDYPEGFSVVDQAPLPLSRRASFFSKLADCDTRDVANFASLEVRRETEARWRRIRAALRMHMLSKQRSSSSLVLEG